MSFHNYLQLIDWTSRSVRKGHDRVVSAQVPALLERLRIDTIAWTSTMQPAGNLFGRAIGRLERLRQHARAIGQCWIKGASQADRLYQAL